MRANCLAWPSVIPSAASASRAAAFEVIFRLAASAEFVLRFVQITR